MTWTLYPAIDVREGRVVRLEQGDYGRQTTYPGDPAVLAERYRADGAEWLHLVDLDAARTGGYGLTSLVEDISRRTGLRIQTGGGVRSADDVERLLASGAERVVVGTLAIREPDLVQAWLLRFGAQRLTLALDARQDATGAWRLPIRGWTEDSTVDMEALLDRYTSAGLVNLLCTDIARDGTLSGFNLALYSELRLRWPHLQVQASGGASGVADVRAVRAAGAAGAVLGKALLEGRLALDEALSC